MILLNLIFGVVAGYVAPMVEPRVADIFALAAPKWKPEPREISLLTLLALFALSHVLLWIGGAESSVFMICAGAALGIYGKRLLAFVLRREDEPDY